MSGPPADGLLAAAADRRPRFLEDLEALVDIDSGSGDPGGVNRMADACVARLERRGWAVERIGLPLSGRGIETGDAVVARLAGSTSSGRRVLLLAHMDTVFPAGTAQQRPFRTEDGRALGPGVADMKGGIVAGITAVDVLRDLGHDRFCEIALLLTPDEEIGSVASGDLVRRIAAEADVGLCLESARENGDIVSARKGVADIRIEITGRAAHAGVEPERGANAALEAARTTIALQELNAPERGLTVNVGVVRAGTVRNVIAPQARLEVDVRAWDPAAFDEVQRAVLEIGRDTSVPGTSSNAERLTYYPPMQRTAAIERLAELAAETARELGFEIDHAATGGSSDANTAASVGLPVLDGLGPIGGDDHGPDEWLALDSIAPRTALLAGLITRLGQPASR